MEEEGEWLVLVEGWVRCVLGRGGGYGSSLQLGVMGSQGRGVVNGKSG
jgi:hypothetical protein